MVTFLAGGTGTPKLLQGVPEAALSSATVVGNTGDDVEIGGLMVCPDLDTVLYLGADILDRETWWGIAGDTFETNDRLAAIAETAELPDGPRYLPNDRQTSGRPLARWRRFAAVPEFMRIGDRDRATHLARTSLLDEGHTLTEVTRTLAEARAIPFDLVPMSDDPVASIVHTPDGPVHFQAFWVAHRGEPAVERVEFRGAENAEPAPAALDALTDPVVIGPSNPVTSIGPMVSMAAFRQGLEDTSVVAVSPFVEDRVFSGPAAKLMTAAGYEPSTRGVAEAYPFADAFVLDEADGTTLDRPIVRTDTTIESIDDAERVYDAVRTALAEVDA